MDNIYGPAEFAIPDTPTCKLSKFSMVLMFLMKVGLIFLKKTWLSALVCISQLYLVASIKF